MCVCEREERLEETIFFFFFPKLLQTQKSSNFLCFRSSSHDSHFFTYCSITVAFEELFSPTMLSYGMFRIIGKLNRKESCPCLVSLKCCVIRTNKRERKNVYKSIIFSRSCKYVCMYCKNAEIALICIFDLTFCRMQSFQSFKEKKVIFCFYVFGNFHELRTDGILGTL